MKLARENMLEGTRIVLFSTTLAAVALSVAMHLGRAEIMDYPGLSRH